MKKGFTLVETVVVISLTVAIFLALTNLFLVFNSIYGRQQAQVGTAGSAGRTLSALEASLLPAEKVLSSYNFSGTVYSSNASTLVLQLPSVNSAGSIVTGAKDYVAFYVVSGTLYRMSAPSAQSVRVAGISTLSTTVNTLSFTYNDNDFTKVTNVAVTIQNQVIFKQDLIQSTLSGQWYLRNFLTS